MPIIYQAGSTIVRTHEPGDMGLITYNLAKHYSRECGFNHNFESMVGVITGRFVGSYDPSAMVCYIAELRGAFAGCVMVNKHEGDETCAQLRFLHVVTEVRRRGLGTILVNAAVEFAKRANYHKMRMYIPTNAKFLNGARLCAKANFQKTDQQPHCEWGTDLLMGSHLLLLPAGYRQS